MPRYACRVDRNHAEVREALRAYGWDVQDLSDLGGGMPDLLARKPGRFHFCEVKDGSKPPSAQQLTAKQVRLHALFQSVGIPVVILRSVADAERL